MGRIRAKEYNPYPVRVYKETYERLVRMFETTGIAIVRLIDEAVEKLEKEKIAEKQK